MNGGIDVKATPPSRSRDPQHGTDRTYCGSWVGVGSTSVVNCPTLGGYTWYEIAANIQLR